MSCHEGVSCDSCSKTNFRGKRFKCLICYDYDLCGECYEEGATSARHLVDHPMQCILTRSDIEMYYGGESVNTDQQQSFTCPCCNKMGFSENTLLDHVTVEHPKASLKVLCPICACSRGGDPNVVTDDFAGHLTSMHRQGPRELILFLDEPNVMRRDNGVRRVPARALAAPSRDRAELLSQLSALTVPRNRHSNVHFSSSPPSRDTADPRAELLSQLSAVGRGGLQPSQLQQLQIQIQLEKLQMAGNRSQVDRLPPRTHTNGIGPSPGPPTMAEMLNANNNGIPINLNHSSSLSSNNTSFSSEGPPLHGMSNDMPSTSAAAAASAGNSTIGGSSSSRNNVWNANASSATQPNFNQLSTGNRAGGFSFSGPAHSNADSSTSPRSNENNSNFLLSHFNQPSMTETEESTLERNRADRSLFIQALLLSLLSHNRLPTSYLAEDEHISLEENKINDNDTDDSSSAI